MATSIGVLDFLIVSAYYIILAFLLRLISVQFADRPVGRAVGILHG